MAIIGLTDRGASFPRIGELRKGGEKPAVGNKPGADLRHFRFTSTDDAIVSKFRDVYGNEPRMVHCFLPYQTTDENFDAWIEEWGAGSLKWRGDGKHLVMWQKPDGTFSQERKAQPAGGKQVGRLKVILPGLGRLAYVVSLTTSIHDIMEIHANLTAYEALRGDLRGIPFILSRVPRMISTPGKDGRVRREKWLLHIEAAPEWVQAQLSVMERDALPGGGQMLLEAGDIEPDDDVDYETGEIVTGTTEPMETDPPAPSPASVTLRKKLHAVGKKTYGDAWDDKRPQLVESVSKHRVTSSNNLTDEEMRSLITGMEKKLATPVGTAEPTQATQSAAFDALPSATAGGAYADAEG